MILLKYFIYIPNLINQKIEIKKHYKVAIMAIMIFIVGIGGIIESFDSNSCITPMDEMNLCKILITILIVLVGISDILAIIQYLRYKEKVSS
jgi:hypothetical protein